MAKSPKVLLLQARRETDPMRQHEADCFSSKTKAELVAHDLHDGPPTLDSLNKFDALMIGGSGDYYASKRDLPNHAEMMGFLQDLVETSTPVFAVCFGYHCLVDALGGTIIHDPENTEVGTFDLELTDQGKTDPLLGAMPPRFSVQMGHKDRPESHPPGITNLASSARSPLQAFRLPSKQVWGVQFHPELDKETNLDRFRHYLDGYSACMTQAERENALSGFGHSPDASTLLLRFLDLL